MAQSKNSSNTLKVEEYQLPLKGFRGPMKVSGSKHEFSIQGMGEGRYRVHVRVNR